MGITIIRPGTRLIASNVRIVRPGTVAATFNVLSLSGLMCWFDAQDAATAYQDSALTTAATANGTDPVGGWKDKSGNNYHALQTISAKRPVFFNNLIGGKNAVKSDGVDDYLITPSITHNITTGDFYVACVLRRHTSQTDYCDVFSLSNGGFAGTFLRNTTNDKLSTYTSGLIEFNTTLALNTNYVIELWRSGGTLAAAVNGTQESNTFSDTFNLINTTSLVFCSTPITKFSAIYIAELIFTKTMPANRALVANYLRGRYGI